MGSGEFSGDGGVPVTVHSSQRFAMSVTGTAPRPLAPSSASRGIHGSRLQRWATSASRVARDTHRSVTESRAKLRDV